MSDSTALSNLEWEPLVPENRDPATDASDRGATAGAVPHPKTAEDIFQFLYPIPEDSKPGKEFIPFYGPPVSEADWVDPETVVEVEEETEASETLEEIRQRAYEEGLSLGKKEGFEAGRETAAPIVEQIQNLLKEMDGLWYRLVETYEERIIQLVGRVAEKVVLAHVGFEHDTVKRVILDAFRMIPEPAEVTIDIHPQDVERIENIKGTFFEQVKALKQVSLVPNPSISPGGCRIKTRLGEVDATLESRLAAVHETIMTVYRNKGQNAGDA